MPTSCTVRSLLCTVCTLYNYLVNIDADVAMMPCANVDNVVSAPMNQDKCSVDRILGPYVESSAPQKDEYRMDSNLEKKDQGNKEIKMLHTKLRRSSARLPPEALQSVSHVLCHAFVCLYLNEIDNITPCSS